MWQISVVHYHPSIWQTEIELQKPNNSSLINIIPSHTSLSVNLYKYPCYKAAAKWEIITIIYCFKIFRDYCL